jgi:sulfatase maturation enzyme AslB (radical SAM superfamily)
LIISLDAYGEVNDYIRSGSSYEGILENIRYIKEKLPNTRISINSVASILSLESVPDLGKDLLSRDLVSTTNMMFGICHHPVEYEITAFTPETKALIKRKFEDYYIWIVKNVPKFDINYINKCKGIIKHMMSKDDSHLLPTTIEKLTILDNARGVDYRKVIKNL